MDAIIWLFYKLLKIFAIVLSGSIFITLIFLIRKIIIEKQNAKKELEELQKEQEDFYKKKNKKDYRN